MRLYRLCDNINYESCAASVRGPRHVVTSGQTPVLDPPEARALLDSIDTASVVGLRDRALIGLMVYSFARIGAALGMSVEDVFTQNLRLWVRLREKGGKRHAMPCHHNLEEYLTAYLDGAGLRGDRKGPLFRTIGRGTAKLTRPARPVSVSRGRPPCGGRACAYIAWYGNINYETGYYDATHKLGVVIGKRRSRGELSRDEVPIRGGRARR